MGSEDPLALLPEIFLVVGAVLTLVGGSFTPRSQQWRLRLVAAAALLGAAVSAAVPLAAAPRAVWDETYAIDTATGVARLVVVLGTLLVVGIGVDELAGGHRESETYSLLLLSALGAVAMAGTTDLLVLAVAYLLASIPLYALIGTSRTPRAAEAALKTYLLGAIFGITLLLGVTILQGIGRATLYADLGVALSDAPPAALAAGVVAVFGGLLFKAGGVPAHFWVPDAAQGAGPTAAAFLTTIPKIGALVAAYRLVDAVPGTVDLPLLVAVLAALSMTLGNLAAFAQTEARRLLGWSTVSQVGYLLVPVAVAGRSDLALPSLLLYLGAYAVTNLAAFAVTAALPDRVDLASYRGLAGAHPWLAGALVLSLLGLVGTPPTAVFVGKLTTFAAGWDGGLAWLVVVAAINTVASLFYYLRWVAPVFAKGPAESFQPLPWARAAAVVAAAASIALGVGAGLVWPVLSGLAR